LAALVTVTFTASYEKVFSANPRVGFLSHARQLASEVPTTAERARDIPRLIFNDRLDAVVTGVLIFFVVLILSESALVWYRIVIGKRATGCNESEYVPTQFVGET
jgi:carbon starvation protein